MLQFFTTLALRRGRAVAALVAVAVPLMVIVGGGVADRLSAGGFEDPGAESTTAAELLAADFLAGPPDYVVVATALDDDITSDQSRTAGLELTTALAAHPGVEEAVSFWAVPGVPVDANPLVSDDGRQALVTARLSGDETERRATAEELAELLDDESRLALRAGGLTEAARQSAEQAEKDLKTSELIAVPLTLLALLLVFRGWRAAILPLIVAILAVLGTFVALTAISVATEVSTFALNLTTALGLGLAVDYSLLLVARFRDELARADADTPDDAVVARALHQTMQTAGRTILFSAATVAASLLALLVFPSPYLRSFAFAGGAVVICASLSTLVVAPVLLGLFGRRLGVANAGAGRGFWHRQTERVVARPVPWLAAVAVLLIVLGLPFVRFRPTTIDERVLPADAGARQAAEQIATGFDAAQLAPVTVVAPDLSPRQQGEVERIESLLLAVPGVARVDSALGIATAAGRIPDPVGSTRFAGPDATWFSVTLDVSPESDGAEGAVAEIRSVAAGTGHELLVGGQTATRIDSIDAVTARVPIALAVIATTTLVLLFLMTGSVVVPLKALGLNLLSLTATFGALVWIFQEGNLGGLGTTTVDRLDVFTPILMFCIAFGLSMDYEVFLLARIKEEYDLGGDNDRAVVEGIGHTGKLVSAAAVLLAIVFITISFSGVSVVRMFGVGLTIAVITDAFAVRATLTPALIKLAGATNWWAPRPLRSFHLRFGLWEDDPVTLPFQAGSPATPGPPSSGATPASPGSAPTPALIPIRSSR